MLQQTTVKAVIPYYLRFLEKWPTAQDLAQAPRDDVLAAWAGLGYYSRARNLHACAQMVARQSFPPTAAGLRELPGVGAYTAAAIAAIAFGEAAVVMDGNVERVLARIFAVETPLPAAKRDLYRFAALLTPNKRPGDYAQALMDLGATVCTPRSPSCLICPVRQVCKGAATGTPEQFPVKLAKAVKPTRNGAAFVIISKETGSGFVLLRKRDDKGLLGGMFDVPGTAWLTDKLTEAELPAWTRFPATLAWRQTRQVLHTFTHFNLRLDVFAASCDARFAAEGEWAPLRELSRFALPTVIKKVIASGLTALGYDHPEHGTDASSASRVSSVEPSARPLTRAGRK